MIKKFVKIRKDGRPKFYHLLLHGVYFFIFPGMRGQLYSVAALKIWPEIGPETRITSAWYFVECRVVHVIWFPDPESLSIETVGNVLESSVREPD